VEGEEVSLAACGTADVCVRNGCFDDACRWDPMYE
jgi:hypothetical protein